MPNILTLDCETTIKNKGSPFTKSNKLCLVGIHDDEGYTCYDIEYSDSPYGDKLAALSSRICSADLMVGFNLKFDLHWIRRYIPDVSFPRVFDCQLAEFVLGHQGQPYPALAEACSRRGLGSKLDVVANEYWKHGIDTTSVPLGVLSAYLARDVELTRALFDVQRHELDGNLKKMFILQCQDLLVLEEMEWNGMLYNRKEAYESGVQVRAEIEEIDAKLRDLAGDERINFSSDDHLSCLLYGGRFWVVGRETYWRELKSGERKQHERNIDVVCEYPRLVVPNKRTEGKATRGIGDSDLARLNSERVSDGKRPLERRWSVAEPILRGLKAKGKAKKIIELILERAKLTKLDSTYYTGLLDKYEEMEWDTDRLHGQFNQCVARTGRLSSSSPNLQNFSGDIKGLFYSEFNHAG